MCTPGHTTICDWATSMNAVKKVLQHKDFIGQKELRVTHPVI